MASENFPKPLKQGRPLFELGRHIGSPPSRITEEDAAKLESQKGSPQNRQVGSAFALTYRLLLRSCNRMGVFVIPPLPPMLLEPLQTAGPLRSPGITPVHHYSGPGRHPLAFHRFPGVSGYKVSLLRRFLERDEEGFSSCLAYPCHRAAPTTPPKLLAALVSCDDPCCLRPRNEGSTFGFSFRGHQWVHLRCGPGTCSPS
jgi:hypothetical protein